MFLSGNYQPVRGGDNRFSFHSCIDERKRTSNIVENRVVVKCNKLRFTARRFVGRFPMGFPLFSLFPCVVEKNNSAIANCVNEFGGYM